MGGTVPLYLPCLVCGKHGPSHEAHWPVAKGMGGRSPEEESKLPKVPMCFECHIGGEHTSASERVTKRLIARAPGYWQDRGEWEAYQETFERWASLYEHKRGQR